MDLDTFLALDADGRKAHLASLNGEQLAELMDALRGRFNDLDGQPATADVIAAQEQATDAILLARAENDVRLEAEAAAEQRRADLRKTVAEDDGKIGAGDANSGEGDPHQPDKTGDEQRDAPGQPPHPDPAPEPPSLPVQEPAAEPESVLAAGNRTPARRSPTPGAMSRRQPAQTQPRQILPERTVASFRVAEGVPAARAGSEVDWARMGELVNSKLSSVEEFDVSGKFAIAQLDWTSAFGPDRRLDSKQSARENTELIERVTNREAMTAAAQAYLATNPSDADALTAAGGGFCAPFPVDYSVPTQGSTARPVRDALARFGADRGGIQFTTPLVLSNDPTTDGVSTWTAADDSAVTIDPATGIYSSPKTKRIVEYACLPETTEQVYAVVLRQSFSNFNARFNPEQVAAHQQLGLVNWSRYADQLLLQALWQRQSFRVTTTLTLGAARDFFALLDTVLWQARTRERLDQGFPMRCLAPSWLMDMFRADFVRQMPAYADPSQTMALADATVRAWAATRNVNLTWTLDERDGGATSFARTQASLAVDGTGTAVLNDFPDVVEWQLFPEGAYQFLDGGTLDLGIVRDTRTNAVNRYETFTESFEGIAKRGTYGYAIRSALQPTGAAAGLVATGALDL